MDMDIKGFEILGKFVFGAFSGLIVISVIMLILLFLICIITHIALAIFLNKLNKLTTGKGTALAWIPVCNIYLLGKLTFNKIVGWILVGVVFLTTTFSITINGVRTVHTILPEGLRSIVQTFYNIAIVGLLIYAIIKYIKLKKNNSTQLSNPQILQQTNLPNEQKSESTSSNNNSN